MLRLLTFVLPLLLKGPTKGPIKNLVGRSAFSALAFFGFFFLLAALFVWLMVTYSLVVAFLAMAVIFFSGALLMLIKQRLAASKKGRRISPTTKTEDALTGLLPDSLASDPSIQHVLREIGKNPIPAAAIAALVGAVVARELFKKD